MIHVAMIEDDSVMAELLEEFLAKHNIKVTQLSHIDSNKFMNLT